MQEEISIVQLVADFGFPVVMVMGLGYFVYYVWQWVTKEIDPVLGDASKTLIGLIDRVRMLDNDMIRLTQKLNMVLEFKDQYEKMTGRKLDIDLDAVEEEMDAIKKKRKRMSKDV